MNEPDPIEQPAIVEKPKRKRGRPHVIQQPRPKAKSEFAGMTLTECCIDCTPQCCLITSTAHCGHPRKGGLHAGEMLNPRVTELYRKARKELLHFMVDARKD